MAWSLPDGAVLGIFGDRPDMGRIPPRMASAFGPDRTAEMREAMLFDQVETWGSDRVLAPGGRRVLVFAPDDAGPWFDARVPASFALQPQAEGDTGERMRAFFEGEFEDGASRVVLIGADAPTLDPSIVVSAFLCLDGRDVVIGPSSEGGIYLVGSRLGAPPVFDAIDWGTPAVLGQMIDRLRDTRLSLAVLPPWYVVDAPEAWVALAGHLRAMRRAGVDPALPRVEALIGRDDCSTRADCSRPDRDLVARSQRIAFTSSQSAWTSQSKPSSGFDSSAARKASWSVIHEPDDEDAPPPRNPKR
jgi:glycosyltransferase A (GT-A) superfamily protein (DUF2064 family)